MSEYIDNVSQRKRMLKEALAGLHEGRSVEDVQEIFAELVKVATYDDIAEAEQMLINEGLPAAEIQKLCDLHVAVVRDALDAAPTPDSMSGHPVHTMRAENEIAATMLQQINGLMTVPGREAMELVRDRLEQLMQYNRHYLRKENLLFPYLERTGFTGPSQVMWGIHDEIRADWKQITAKLSRLDRVNDWTAFLKELRSLYEPMRTRVEDMIYKEEKILFPASLERLTDKDWAEIRHQEPELGYFVVRPGQEWQPKAPEPTQPPAPKATEQTAATFTPGVGVNLSLNTGVLTPEQLNMMLTSLPFDITYVDENDEVRYFTQGKERIFERQPAIIGRKVQMCHPPQSMDKVQRILDDFRAGTRDVAEFWIQMMGKFILIRYYALRDSAGEYRGTIEVTQDVSPIRALQGEKRLLDD